MKTIGVIRTPFVDNFAIPRQGNLAPSALGRIQLDRKSIAPSSLEGLKVGQGLWIHFIFHKNQELRASKVAPPRLSGQKLGVFATRSPHRPNPIGMTLSRIIEVYPENLEIIVQGIDMVDQTPIIDLKPYIKYADFIEDESNDWPRPTAPIQIQWTETAREQLKKYNLKHHFKNLIEERLKYDPRPENQKNKKEHYFIIQEDWDVKILFQENIASILEIIKIEL